MTGQPTCIVSSWEHGLAVFQGGTVKREFEGQGAWGLAPDGDGGAYAIVGPRDVWNWSPGGAWRPVATADADIACCLGFAGRLLVGTEDARILAFSEARWETLDGLAVTPGREHWYAGAALVEGRLMGPPLGIRSLSATCDGSALLANVHVGGIPRSTDNGASWAPTIEIDADVHQVLGHPGRREIVAAAAAAGLCLSRDGGRTWSITADGLHASYSLAVALTQDRVYLTSSTDHFSGDGAVYRRRIDGEGPLEACGHGLPERMGGIVDTGCLHARDQDLIVADQSGRLHGSRDGGESWALWEDGLPTPSGALLC
jgi:hypothetical protein